MEKHHRKLSDPWSQRQCGVYQQLQHTRRSCRYVMLNLTDQPKRLLEKSLGSRSFCCYQAIHAQLLALLTSNWPDYVEYLSTALTEHVGMADIIKYAVCCTNALRAIEHTTLASTNLISTILRQRTKTYRTYTYYRRRSSALYLTLTPVLKSVKGAKNSPKYMLTCSLNSLLLAASATIQ